jgi:hypothetical protein
MRYRACVLYAIDGPVSPVCVDTVDAVFKRFDAHMYVDLIGDGLLFLLHQLRLAAYAALYRFFVAHWRHDTIVSRVYDFWSVVLHEGRPRGSTTEILLDGDFHPILGALVCDYVRRPRTMFPPQDTELTVCVASDGWGSVVAELSASVPIYSLVVKSDALHSPLHFTGCVDILTLVPSNRDSLAPLSDAQLKNASLLVSTTTIRNELRIGHASFFPNTYANATVRRVDMALTPFFAHRFPFMRSLAFYNRKSVVPVIDATGCPRLVRVKCWTFDVDLCEAILCQVPTLAFDIHFICGMFAKDFVAVRALIKTHAPHMLSHTWLPRLHMRFGPDCNALAGFFFMALERMRVDPAFNIAHSDPAATEHIMRFLTRLDITSAFM